MARRANNPLLERMLGSGLINRATANIGIPPLSGIRESPWKYFESLYDQEKAPGPLRAVGAIFRKLRTGKTYGDR